MEILTQKGIVVTRNPEVSQISNYLDTQFRWDTLLEIYGDVSNISNGRKQVLTNEHYRLVSRASRDGLFDNFDKFLNFVSELDDISFSEKLKLLKNQKPSFWEDMEKEIIEQDPEYKGLLGSLVIWRVNTIYSESLQLSGKYDNNNFFELENQKTLWGASPDKKEFVKRMKQTSLPLSLDRIKTQDEVEVKHNTNWKLTSIEKNMISLLTNRLVNSIEIKKQEKIEEKEQQNPSPMGIFEATTIAIESLNTPHRLIEYLFKEARNKRLSLSNIDKLNVLAKAYTGRYF